jgi:acetyltransferase (GNAT) family protein
MAVNTLEISAKGKWIHVPAAEVGGKTVIATGGFVKTAVVWDEQWLDGEIEDPEVFINTLKQRRSEGFKADIFSFTQKLPNTSPRHAYPVEWDNVAAIRLTSFDDWFQKLSQDTRRNVRMAAKRGVVVKVTALDDELIRGIMGICDDAPIRQGRRFYHFGKAFDAVRKDYSSFLERSEYIGAYLQDELIGMMKIVYVGKVASVMQLLLKVTHYDKKAGNALVAKAVEHCQKKGMSYLTFLKYRYGNKHDNPLTEFKRRNGFEEVLVPRFNVPLTAKGRVMMALNLHRPLLEILPERLIYKLLKLRSWWCEWSLRTSAVGQRLLVKKV